MQTTHALLNLRRLKLLSIICLDINICAKMTPHDFNHNGRLASQASSFTSYIKFYRILFNRHITRLIYIHNFSPLTRL